MHLDPFGWKLNFKRPTLSINDPNFCHSVLDYALILILLLMKVEPKSSAPSAASASDSAASSALPMRAGVPTTTPLLGPTGFGPAAAGYLYVESSVLDKKEGGGGGERGTAGGSSLHEFNASSGSGYGAHVASEGSTLSPRTGRARSPKT